MVLTALACRQVFSGVVDQVWRVRWRIYHMRATRGGETVFYVGRFFTLWLLEGRRSYTAPHILRRLLFGSHRFGPILFVRWLLA